jgi:hypothetical protein
MGEIDLGRLEEYAKKESAETGGVPARQATAPFICHSPVFFLRNLCVTFST